MTDESTPVKRGMLPKLLTLLTLFSALSALGLAGYMWWRVEIENPLEPAVRTMQQLDSRIEKLDARSLSTVDAELRMQAGLEKLETALALQREDLQTAQTAVAEALAAMHNEGPPSVREWKLAEVEYLLRIANHRLLMERDAAGAQMLLAAADAILADLDDYALHQVRARLADERMSLQNLPVVDTQGIFLRLEAIKNALGGLPIKLPEYIGEAGVKADPKPAEDAETSPSLTERLFSLFEFRRHASPNGVRPLLRADEATYLEQNLRLAIERAQLAALRGDQLLFEVSLESARHGLSDYLDPENAAVRNVAAELDDLLKARLDIPIPDISGSLTRLVALRAQSGAQSSAQSPDTQSDSEQP